MMTGEKLNKSERIRRLFDGGMSVTEIAAYMNIRYQFAYNVVSYYVKQKAAEVNANANRTAHYSSIHLGN